MRRSDFGRLERRLWLRRFEPMRDVLRPTHFHDWGKLMLAFTMLWAYFSVSQLIIQWSGNLPEEVPWYLARTSGMWKVFPYLIIALHFFVPFVLLLSSDLKSDSRRLAGVSASRSSTRETAIGPSR